MGPVSMSNMPKTSKANQSQLWCFLGGYVIRVCTSLSPLSPHLKRPDCNVSTLFCSYFSLFFQKIHSMIPGHQMKRYVWILRAQGFSWTSSPLALLSPLWTYQVAYSFPLHPSFPLFSLHCSSPLLLSCLFCLFYFVENNLSLENLSGILSSMSTNPGVIKELNLRGMKPPQPTKEKEKKRDGER